MISPGLAKKVKRCRFSNKAASYFHEEILSNFFFWLRLGLNKLGCYLRRLKIRFQFDEMKNWGAIFIHDEIWLSQFLSVKNLAKFIANFASIASIVCFALFSNWIKTLEPRWQSDVKDFKRFVFQKLIFKKQNKAWSRSTADTSSRGACLNSTLCVSIDTRVENKM